MGDDEAVSGFISQEVSCHFYLPKLPYVNVNSYTYLLSHRKFSHHCPFNKTKNDPHETATHEIMTEFH